MEFGVDSATDRASLRRHYRNVRRRLSVAAQRRHALGIRRHFLCSPLVWRARRIAAYLAIDGEPDLQPLLASLAAMGKQLALPVIRRDRRMDFFAYDANTPLIPNRYGILEPAPGARYVHTLSLGLVLTPLVAFDDSGNRLGMGGGFYDRHFARVPDGLGPRLVGVAHEAQRAPALEAAPWDQPLDGVLTEAGYRRNNSTAGLPVSSQ